MNDVNIINNHIYIQYGELEIGFVFRSNKNFVEIETENKDREKFNITLRLIDFLTIAETIKCAAGIGNNK